MSGDIFFGVDKSLPQGVNDGYVNSPTFMAVGDLLGEALAESQQDALEIIKEAEPMAIYSFNDLSVLEYNSVIAAMRKYIGSLVAPTEWQQKGIWVWREMAEPFIRKDERYDFAFHHEGPPTR